MFAHALRVVRELIVIVSDRRPGSPPYSSLFGDATVATSSVILSIQFHVRSDLLVCGGSNSNATCQQFARGAHNNRFRVLKNPFESAGCTTQNQTFKLLSY